LNYILFLGYKSLAFLGIAADDGENVSFLIPEKDMAPGSKVK